MFGRVFVSGPRRKLDDILSPRLPCCCTLRVNHIQITSNLRMFSGTRGLIRKSLVFFSIPVTAVMMTIYGLTRNSNFRQILKSLVSRPLQMSVRVQDRLPTDESTYIYREQLKKIESTESHRGAKRNVFKLVFYDVWFEPLVLGNLFDRQ